MKRKLLLMFTFVALSAVLSGCKNDNPNPGPDPEPPKGPAKMDLTLNFDPGAVTRAPQSSAIPITNWNNIKSLLLLITSDTGMGEIVRDARAINVPTSNTDNLKAIQGVATGTYNVYLIANATPADNTGPYGGSISDLGTPGGADWTFGNVKGLPLNTLNLALKQLPGMTTNYDSPNEVFVARTAGVVVLADQNTPVSLSLKRIVSLVRVRIDKDINTTADFAAPEAILALSRLQKQVNVSGGILSNSVNTLDYIYKAGAYNTGDPTTGYSPLQIVSGNYQTWKEVIMFPTSNTPAPGAKPGSTRKLFVKLAAWVPAGYVFQSGTVATAPTLAWWGANMDDWCIANQITEVNCKLTSRGEEDSKKVVPFDEGRMEITINYTDWNGAIETTNMEM